MIRDAITFGICFKVIVKDRGAWQTTIHEVVKSQTQQKQLSMHALKHIIINLILVL